MKRCIRSVFWVALSGLILAVCGLSAAQAGMEPARSADDFVDRIGFCTHWSYADTPYGTGYEQVKRLLGECGIRHVRDGYSARHDDLYRTYGIRATMIYGPQMPIDAIVASVKAHRYLADMIEGPNEVDIFPSNSSYEGKVFPQGPIAFQNRLYAALKGDPVTRALGIIAPSTANIDSNMKLAPLASCDYTVMHSYAGGGPPETSLEGGYVPNLVNAERILGPGAVAKPIVVTESGYHTALQSGGGVIAGVQPAVSEPVQAKYLLRHFAAYFNVGIVRTFVYEFVDEFKDEATNAEASFGIVRHDLSPKPAYGALKRLIGLLRESVWDKAAQRWRARLFAPTALDFTLSGDAERLKSIRHTLLQKSNGDYYLLIWQEVPSFDTKRKTEIAVPDLPVTLTLRRPALSAAAYRIGESSEPTQRWGRSQELKLSVPDQVLAVRITPVPAHAAQLPAPTRLAGSGTNSSITLSWRPAAGAQGYFVWRLGRYIGRASGTAYRDTAVRPATGYPYEVRGFDAQGNVSAAAACVASTTNRLPDLTVTALTWTPVNPRFGDAVRFQATIKNIGVGASPSGVTHGVAFEVDGKTVTWSDTFNGPLGPGESRTLTANNGPAGATWQATAGAHHVTAHVDDVGRINETSVSNNTLERQMRVGD